MGANPARFSLTNVISVLYNTSMEIKIRKASTDTRMVALASEALRVRLYVPGWQLSFRLREIKQSMSSRKTSIGVAYVDGVPIGVCVSQQWHTPGVPTVTVFVRKKYRRLGIGTKLIKRVVGAKTEFNYERGTDGSAEFFERFSGAEFSR